MLILYSLPLSSFTQQRRFLSVLQPTHPSGYLQWGKLGDTVRGIKLEPSCLGSTARAETSVVVERRPIKEIKERLREPMAVVKRETRRGGEEMISADFVSLYRNFVVGYVSLTSPCHSWSS